MEKWLKVKLLKKIFNIIYKLEMEMGNKIIKMEISMRENGLIIKSNKLKYKLFKINLNF